MSAYSIGGAPVFVLLCAVCPLLSFAAPEGVGNQTSGELVIPQDTKDLVDARLGDKRIDFDYDECDRLLSLAPPDILIPYLVQVLRDEERDWPVRQKAAFALGRSEDSRGESASLQLIEEYLRPGREELTYAESKVLYTCIYNLGRYGTDKAVDEAFKLLRPEFWSTQDLPVPDIPQRDMRFTVVEYRNAALIGLSFAGTERTIKALETGEGIPPDLLARNKGAMKSFLEDSQKARERRLQKQSGAKAEQPR